MISLWWLLALAIYGIIRTLIDERKARTRRANTDAAPNSSGP